MDRKILAIIPARGGSKGLPRKNIRLMLGRPLIAWTIEEAKKSKYIDRLVVCTEDKEITEMCCSLDVEIIRRPDDLATDSASVHDTILYCLNILKEKESYIPEHVMLLQCTSPLRKAVHIDEAIELLTRCNSEAVVSVCREKHSPYWLKTVDEQGFTKDFLQYDKKSLVRRQDLPILYRLNGSIYISKTETYLNRKSFDGDGTQAYVMDSNDSIDIDDEIDFLVAELLLKRTLLQS
ncbi:MAG: cytidylyltransferase domain-containing protein [Bacillota bacterium]